MDKKFFAQVAGLMILIFAGTYLTKNQGILNSYLVNSPQSFKNVQMKIGENIIDVEIADTDNKRRLGLGGRDVLATNSGMLFIFESPRIPSFWMKGMKFPLDFIWIKGEKVVDLTLNVAPPNQFDKSLPTFSPNQEIDKVLEVNSGYIDSHNIKIGDSAVVIKN